MKGIRVLITKVGAVIDEWTREDDPNGWAFTDAQLTALKQEIWDAAREHVVSEEQEPRARFQNLRLEDKYKTLADYEKEKAEFLERKGNG